MRPVHILSVLALATRTFPGALPAFPGPLSSPIDCPEKPSVSHAMHKVPWTTCDLFSGSCLFSGRGAPSALGAHSLSLRPVTRHTLRKRDTRPALSTRPYAFPAPPTITKTMHRPLSASLFGHTCACTPFHDSAHRLCRGGNQPEIIPILHPSFIPTVDMNRTRDLAPPSTVINAQTPARATPANPRANHSRLTTPFPSVRFPHSDVDSIGVSQRDA